MRKVPKRVLVAAICLILLTVAIFFAVQSRRVTPRLLQAESVTANGLPAFLDREEDKHRVPTGATNSGRNDAGTVPGSELGNLQGADEEGPGVHFQRYNYRSGRMAASKVPELAHPQTQIQSRFGEPLLTVWAEEAHVAVGEKVKIFAKLSDAQGGDVTPAEIVVSITTMRGSEVNQYGTLDPLQSPSGRLWVLDWVAEPALFHFVEPGSTAVDAPSELNVAIHARGTYRGEAFRRSAATMLFVDSPGGRLLAERAQLHKRRGDLKLTVVAELERAGTYWLHAELWGGPEFRTPIAFGVDRLEGVPKGLFTQELLFGGAIIRDKGVDGPFKVRNIRLNQVDTLPPHESKPVDELPETPAWSSQEFA